MLDKEKGNVNLQFWYIAQALGNVRIAVFDKWE